MKNPIIISFITALTLLTGPAQASNQSLASTLEVYVFPANGQAVDQQSKEEAQCYEWAVGNTGSDPFELQKQGQQQSQQTQQQVQQAQSATQGSGARGALRGAAGGALIAEVTGGDAGEGAGYGAALGAISSRRRARAASEQAQTQAQAQGAASQQATADQVGNFKKAFSVCLEAKDYLVKY